MFKPKFIFTHDEIKIIVGFTLGITDYIIGALVVYVSITVKNVHGGPDC